jgi:hypothetical protein
MQPPGCTLYVSVEGLKSLGNGMRLRLERIVARGSEYVETKKSIDLGFLRGREVGQVAIGMYQVIFGFSEDVTIAVEGEFGYSRGREKYTWKPEPGAAHIAACTVALLGATITSFEGHEDGMLTPRVFERRSPYHPGFE